MIKPLFITLMLGLSTFSLMAEDMKIYPGYAFHRVSPDGNLLVSFAYGTLTILDAGNGTTWSYTETYNTGNGNYISDNGIIVGNTFDTDIASFWQNGVWQKITSASKRTLSYANGITPDGSRIVGTVTPESGYDMEGLMLVPCYWDLKEDGTYGEIQTLPYPELDFTGRRPQTVTAVQISQDGKTIAGQVRDYRGINPEPIIYHQDENGEWSYSLFCNTLFHPEGYELPPYPGESEIAYPVQEAYMSDSELEEYEEAYDAWYNEYLETGVYDESTMPQYEDYMTPTEIAKYEAAKAAYEEWEEKYNAYELALLELLNHVPAFAYNNVLLSSDGNLYASTNMQTQFDPINWSFEYDCVPVLFNLENNTIKEYKNDGVNLVLSSMTDSGTLLAAKMGTEEDLSRIAYIALEDEIQFITLYEYLSVAEPTLAEQMKENMTHDFTYFVMDNEGNYEPNQKEVIATGIPFTDREMTVIALGVPNFWDESNNVASEFDSYGYILNLSTSSVAMIGNESGSNIRVLKNGLINLKGSFRSLSIFDIQGKLRFKTNCQESSIDTGLPHGIYILKAIDSNGNSIVKKVNF